MTRFLLTRALDAFVHIRVESHVHSPRLQDFIKPNCSRLRTVSKYPFAGIFGPGPSC